ncbi:TIP41-like protein [Halotydeus destructor]|nr:TIP41-like protein [Halotydeus destructor]
MSGHIDSVDQDGVRVETFEFAPWTFQTGKSHILHSKCVAPIICKKFDNEPDKKCLVCRFESTLDLPSHPEMLFARNYLKIEHKQGFGFEFIPLEALKMVSKEPLELEVGIAKAWQGARADCQFSKRQIVKPFDWTYSTRYQGTLLQRSVGDGDNSTKFEVKVTGDRIDMNKLKQKDEILYYDSIDLFEDELADHGVAHLSVKVRVMRGSYFILLRYFLRVDGTKAQVIDTRYFHEVSNDFILKEFTVREVSLDNVNIPTEVLVDPVQLSSRLPVVHETYEKLYFPS